MIFSRLFSARQFMSSFSPSAKLSMNIKIRDEIVSFFSRLMEIKIEHFVDLFSCFIHSIEASLNPILDGFLCNIVVIKHYPEEQRKNYVRFIDAGNIKG